MNLLKISGLLILGIVVMVGVVTALSGDRGPYMNQSGMLDLLDSDTDVLLDADVTLEYPQGNTSGSVVRSTEVPSTELFEVVEAPLNPDFLDYLKKQKERQNYATSDDQLVIGYFPSPVDFSHTVGMKIHPKERLSPWYYSSAFDLRDQGKVSPVKNQGTEGSCWAFGAYGSLESFLLPDEEWDFSENNMKNLLKPIYPGGFDFDGGGNRDMSTAYLARWSGPIREEDDPYVAGSTDSPDNIPPVKHVQIVHFLPERADALDNDNIKWALTTVGAVRISMYLNESKWLNESSSAYYQDQETTTNHAVTVVGWDDTYDRKNFLIQPPEDGAFIVKNSWGTIWGDQGYFSLSYYDPSIKAMAVFTAEDPTRYDNIYQYDPLGLVNSFGSTPSKSPDTAWFANVFTAVEDETLTAVSFYTPVVDSEYVIDCYTNPEEGPIGDGGSISSSSGTIATPGYHTIEIPGAELYRGQRFSVVVRLRTPGYSYPIPIEYPIEGYSSKATANAGESYISPDGKDWSDCVDNVPNSNVCLKAFTSRKSANTRISVLPASSTLTVGQTRAYTLVLDTAPQGLSGYNVTVQLTNPAVAEIVGVQFPSWSSLAANSTLPADLVWCKAADFTGASGTANITLVTVTVRADATGTTNITVLPQRVEDRQGGRYTPDVLQAHLQVRSSTQPLVANFTANVTAGPPPLAVRFTDTSSGDPAAWSWDFGDGDTADEQNPTHIYTDTGTYTVSLTVSNAAGNDTVMKSGYIAVRPEEPVSIALSPGWNFVSTPKQLANGSDTVGVVFGDIDTGGHAIFTYQDGGLVPMVPDDRFKPLDAIWVYANTSATVPLIYESNPLRVPPSKPLSAGWNAIGSPAIGITPAKEAFHSVRQDWTEVIGFDADAQAYGMPIMNGGTGAYDDGRMLDPTGGYWIFVTRNCTVAAIGQ